MSDPIFYDTVDVLYHAVVDRPPSEKAFLLGSGFTYLLVNRLQWASRNIADFYISNFDENILPTLEKGCIAAMAVAPFLFYLIDPEGAKEIMAQHPVYTSGMFGVWLGSISGAVQDLFKRSKQTPLEERLPEQ